jgi:uncharacterized protein (TIGR02265 family)
MSLPRFLRVTAGSVLTHSFDIEERIEGVSPQETLKGMFFARLLQIAIHAGMHPEGLRLDAPPPGLRYQAFFDYPVTDYFRIAHAAASTLYPSASTAEGLRRIAGRDFAQFADSNVGRVMLAFTGDALSSLQRASPMYSAVLKGSSQIDAERVPGGVRMRYRRYPGPVEAYPIGTVESVFRHYGVEYDVEIDVLSARDADYLIRIRD